MKRHQTNQQSGTPKKLRLIPNVSSAKKRKTQKNQSVSPTKNENDPNFIQETRKNNDKDTK